MKIIHIILGKARIDRMNGINKVAHNLAIHQQKTGHEVEIWGITHSPKDRPPRQSYKLRLFQAQSNRFKTDPELKRYIQALDGSETRAHIHGSFILDFFGLASYLSSIISLYLLSTWIIKSGCFGEECVEKKNIFSSF